jgi:prepilin-type N-terminal cleavage/methylation domain-containing protein
MMTFPHRTKRPWLGLAVPVRRGDFQSPLSKGGFTLLEIVIVLMVFALILGGAITTVVLSSSERALTNASGEIELLAKKARTASILHQKPYAIEFHENYLRLLPFVEASENERTTALGNEIGGTAASDASGPTLREEISIDPDITLSVRRWNTENFIAPSKNLVHVWRFDPNGLSEPVTVRLTIGESYAQDTYHPLTATIADSELEAK